VPLELLREEQERITRELAGAQKVLATTDGDWAVIESNVNQALDLLADPQSLYRNADPVGRKALNQAFFEGLYIDVDGVSYSRAAAPFAQLREKSLNRDLVRYLRESKNPDLASSGRGLRETLLVDLRGLEPLTSSMPWRRSTGLSYRPRGDATVPVALRTAGGLLRTTVRLAGFE
jgi:site-specific DNA recombinase